MHQQLLEQLLQHNQIQQLANLKQQAALNYPANNPFFDTLGARLMHQTDFTCLHLPWRNNLTNSWNNAHGGVMISLMDIGMSLSAYLAHAQNFGAATIQLNSYFLQTPAQKQDLFVLAHVSMQTPTMAFCGAYLLDESQTLCAKASSIFKYSRHLMIN